LPETSALFPTDTKVEMPIPRPRAWSRMASPSAPLWDSMPTLPAGGSVGANVPLSDTMGSVLITPMQLGPTMRMPEPRTRSRSRACAARPSAEASAKPAEITTTPRAPARAHSLTTSSTAGAGTATMPRSNAWPIAETVGQHFRPSITSALGLTGYVGPRKPSRTRFAMRA